jgi:hypothetical protein
MDERQEASTAARNTEIASFRNNTRAKLDDQT